jgi:hypothetical protein
MRRVLRGDVADTSAPWTERARLRPSM